MNFGKFEKDILDTFENFVKPIKDLSIEEKALYSFELNAVLHKILNSYYFERLYRTQLVKEKNDNDQIYYLRMPTDDKYLGSSTYRNAGIFFDELGQITSGKGLAMQSIKISYLYNDIINVLKDKDDFYKIIFESNPIKQSLHLKERHSVNYTVVTPDENSNYQDILKFQKLAYVDESLANDDLKMEQLKNSMKQYDIQLFGQSVKEKEQFVIVAHNNYEICGIAGITKSEKTDLNYMSYISVAHSFRGQKLGVRLFDNVKRELENRNQLMEMSPYNSEGSKYLADNVDVMIQKTSHVLSASEVQKMLPVFNMLNKKDLAADERLDIVKKIHHRIRHDNLDISTMSMTEISELTIRRDVPFVKSEEVKEAKIMFAPIIKKVFSKMF